MPHHRNVLRRNSVLHRSNAPSRSALLHRNVLLRNSVLHHSNALQCRNEPRRRNALFLSNGQHLRNAPHRSNALLHRNGPHHSSVLRRKNGPLHRRKGLLHSNGLLRKSVPHLSNTLRRSSALHRRKSPDPKACSSETRFARTKAYGQPWAFVHSRDHVQKNSETTESEARFLLPLIVRGRRELYEPRNKPRLKGDEFSA